MLTNQSFLDRYLYGLTKLPEFEPTDDVLIGAVRDMDLPKLITARDRKFFQLGQIVAVYGVVKLLKYLLESEGIPVLGSDDDTE